MLEKLLDEPYWGELPERIDQLFEGNEFTYIELDYSGAGYQYGFLASALSMPKRERVLLMSQKVKRENLNSLDLHRMKKSLIYKISLYAYCLDEEIDDAMRDQLNQINNLEELSLILSAVVMTDTSVDSDFYQQNLQGVDLPINYREVENRILENIIKLVTSGVELTREAVKELQKREWDHHLQELKNAL